MNAMQRHMLWRILVFSAASCGVLTLAIILLNTFGLFELWRLGTMPLPAFLLANLLSASPILCQTGPLGTTIAVVFLYQGWIRNSEIVALRAAGLSVRAIALPGIIAGLIALVAFGANSLYVMGVAIPEFADLILVSRTALSYSGLGEGYLNEIGPTAALSFQHRRSLDTLEEVTLLQWPEPGKLFVVTARLGILTKTAAGDVIMLEHGTLQRQIGEQKEAPVTFDHMNALVRPAITFAKQRDRGSYEMPLTYLLLTPPGPNEKPEDYHQRVAEGHQRVITPFVCLNYLLLSLGVLLTRRTVREDLTLRLVGIGAAVATLHIMMVITHGIVARHPTLLPVFYLYTFLPGTIGAILLLRESGGVPPRRRRRDRGKVARAGNAWIGRPAFSDVDVARAEISSR